ncbi:MAG TPA: thiamine-phosphate kinase [Mycobacteriales bacterium]|nr:thiamine-phosphate kinase [Mycobacteriales bacterium]
MENLPQSTRNDLTERTRAITVAEVGEFGLVDRLTARFTASTAPAPVLGPGDDAAVLATPDGRVVATTDLLVDMRHFRRDWSTAEDVGHKAAAQNLADVAAMGAVPTGLLVGLSVPPDTPVAWLEGLADGMRAECDPLGVRVLGGDVVRAEVLMVAVTALGDLQGRQPVTRAGARPGDVVAYTGRLGWAAAGLAVLGRGFRSPVSVVAAHRRPEPPYGQGPRAAELGATAMVDVSDGLVADLLHVALASSVGIELDTSKLDVPAKLRDVGRALGVEPLDWVLAGGDDHALAATFPGASPPPAPWRVIGRVARGRGVVVDGSAYDGPEGFDHFAR